MLNDCSTHPVHLPFPLRNQLLKMPLSWTLGPGIGLQQTQYDPFLVQAPTVVWDLAVSETLPIVTEVIQTLIYRVRLLFESSPRKAMLDAYVLKVCAAADGTGCWGM